MRAKIAFIALATIGALLLLIAVAIEIVATLRGQQLEVPHVVIYVGMLFGFVGFYGLDHRSALDGARFVVQSATSIIAVVRGGGRRKTDAVAVVVDDIDDKKKESGE